MFNILLYVLLVAAVEIFELIYSINPGVSSSTYAKSPPASPIRNARNALAPPNEGCCDSL